MDLLIPDNWLREFLKTDATNKEIAKYLSLCGPSIEKIVKSDIGDTYSIEVTTNRMDSASVYGIAREASAILPQFGKKAKLIEIDSNSKPNYKFSKRVKYLDTSIDSKLCPRFTTVLIKNVSISESPKIIKDRLTASGIRPINNIVDISNYIMLELGQPVHTFDYDKIGGHKMILRKSVKGEKITTLDNESLTLPGGDIVIEDGNGRLIDLCGIMGGSLSAIDSNTKNVLLFVQNYSPQLIRKTSMTLSKRSQASSLFEKGLDSENVESGILRGIEMFIKLTKGIPEKEILDIYPNPYKRKVVKTNLSLIHKKLGIEISKKEILDILTSLQFKPKIENELLTLEVPSFRGNDIETYEDISEEIARIHGYHNLPSVIMSGIIPEQPSDSPFLFEDKIKNILKGYGANEVYTLSLVSKEMTLDSSLKLKNPLGVDFMYLRTSLMSSLVNAASSNLREKDSFHLFEITNVYIPKANDLPNEKVTLAGIFSNTNYRVAKGIIESLLSELNITYEFFQEELKDFVPSERVVIKVKGKVVGELGRLENNNYIYYEFDLEKLRSNYSPFSKYVSIPQNPPQIEDITLAFPEKTKIGDVIQTIKGINSKVNNVELKDTFENNFTFKVWYQDENKTLTDEDVKEIREKIIEGLTKKFGGIFKN